MSKVDSRPWYKKKRYIAGGLVGLAALSSLGGSTPTPSAPAPIVISQPVSTQVSTAPKANPLNYEAPSSGLSNDNYYTNTYGNQVHSPAYSPSVPAGASAQCRDGTYSFSQSRRGTCSHHGGVARWL